MAEADVSPSLLAHELDGASIPLLDDMQAMHIRATRNLLVWTLLGQYARARRLTSIDQLVATGQPRAARQIAWCTTTIKTLAPQALSSAVARELPARDPRRP
jgi:hypothetical protein